MMFEDFMESKKLIGNVEIYLDDDIPEDMDGILRIGSINYYDTNDKPMAPPIDLIDNSEFRSILGIKKYVAKKLDIHLNKICIPED